MSLYTATVVGTVLTRAHIARYNFFNGSITGPFDTGVANLILDRMTNVYDALSTQLDANWSTETISISNAEETGLIEESFTHFGALSGDSLPPFVTATVRFLRPGPGFRHGYKRISGISEGFVQENFISPTFITALETFITGLLLPINSTDGTYQLCQVRKHVNGQPLLLQDWAAAPFTSGVVNGIGTQNTRKD